MAASCGARRPWRWTLWTLSLIVGNAAATAKGADDFIVDKGTSRVYARVDAVRVGHDHGVEGRLVEGRFQPGGVGKLVFDMTTFTCDTPESRRRVGLTGAVSPGDRRKTTANMLSSDVLDVASYATATFDVEKMEPLDGQPSGDPGRYRLTGRFTLHGNTQPLSFPATLSKGDGADEVLLQGTFRILQTDYGITPYSALGGIAKVSNQIQIWGDLRAKSSK